MDNLVIPLVFLSFCLLFMIMPAAICFLAIMGMLAMIVIVPITISAHCIKSLKK